MVLVIAMVFVGWVVTTIENRQGTAKRLIAELLESRQMNNSTSLEILLCRIKDERAKNKGKRDAAFKVASVVGSAFLIPTLLKFDPFANWGRTVFWVYLIGFGIFLLTLYRDVPEVFENFYIERQRQNRYAEKVITQLLESNTSEDEIGTNGVETKAPNINELLSNSHVATFGGFELTWSIRKKNAAESDAREGNSENSHS
jgi:hypothetical protein